MMALSCLLLAYTAYVVPMQLSFWITDDLCNPFPTLYSDVLVDTYFMVRFRSAGAVDWLVALKLPGPRVRLIFDTSAYVILLFGFGYVYVRSAH
jgi:hypothetical protein